MLKSFKHRTMFSIEQSMRQFCTVVRIGVVCEWIAFTCLVCNVFFRILLVIPMRVFALIPGHVGCTLSNPSDNTIDFTPHRCTQSG